MFLYSKNFFSSFNFESHSFKKRSPLNFVEIILVPNRNESIIRTQKVLELFTIFTCI